MANNPKNFLVSTADFAYYVDDVLACTGTTNLNASLEVSMQEQNVNAGKGTIAVEGKGNYKSADFVYFTIVGIDLANCKVFLDNSKRLVVTYNGSELLMNRDYTVYTYSQKKLISQVPINGMNMNTYEKTTYYAVTGNGRFFNTINITDVQKEVKYE